MRRGGSFASRRSKETSVKVSAEQTASLAQLWSALLINRVWGRAESLSVMKDVMMSVSQLVRLNHGLSLSLSISSGFSSGSLTALAFQPKFWPFLRSSPPSLPLFLMGKFSVPSCSHWFLSCLPDFLFVACQNFIIVGGNRPRAENLTSVFCGFELTSNQSRFRASFSVSLIICLGQYKQWWCYFSSLLLKIQWGRPSSQHWPPGPLLLWVWQC